MQIVFNYLKMSFQKYLIRWVYISGSTFLLRIEVLNIIIKIDSHTKIYIHIKWCSLNLFKYFEYIVLQKKKKSMQNYAQIGDIDHCSLHNIFINPEQSLG